MLYIVDDLSFTVTDSYMVTPDTSPMTESPLNQQDQELEGNAATHVTDLHIFLEYCPKQLPRDSQLVPDHLHPVCTYSPPSPSPSHQVRKKLLGREQK